MSEQYGMLRAAYVALLVTVTHVPTAKLDYISHHGNTVVRIAQTVSGTILIVVQSLHSVCCTRSVEPDVRGTNGTTANLISFHVHSSSSSHHNNLGTSSERVYYRYTDMTQRRIN
jgi:hypothetical protein